MIIHFTDVIANTTSRLSLR